MSPFKLITIILFVILVAIFAVLNEGTVEIHYYDFALHIKSVAVPVVVLVLGAFGGGFLLALMFTVFGKMRLKSQVRRKSREVDSLQRDIDRLKPSSVVGHPGADF